MGGITEKPTSRAKQFYSFHACRILNGTNSKSHVEKHDLAINTYTHCLFFHADSNLSPRPSRELRRPARNSQLAPEMSIYQRVAAGVAPGHDPGLDPGALSLRPKTTKYRDVSTGLLTRPFACLLVPLTH